MFPSATTVPPFTLIGGVAVEAASLVFWYIQNEVIKHRKRENIKMLKLNFDKKYNGELKFKGIMVQFGLKIIKMNGNFQEWRTQALK